MRILRVYFVIRNATKSIQNQLCLCNIVKVISAINVVARVPELFITSSWSQKKTDMFHPTLTFYVTSREQTSAVSASFQDIRATGGHSTVEDTFRAPGFMILC